MAEVEEAIWSGDPENHPALLLVMEEFMEEMEEVRLEIRHMELMIILMQKTEQIHQRGLMFLMMEMDILEGMDYEEMMMVIVWLVESVGMDMEVVEDLEEMEEMEILKVVEVVEVMVVMAEIELVVVEVMVAMEADMMEAEVGMARGLTEDRLWVEAEVVEDIILQQIVWVELHIVYMDVVEVK